LFSKNICSLATKEIIMEQLLEAPEYELFTYAELDEEDEMPTFTHSYLQFRVIALLKQYLESHLDAQLPITFQGKTRRFTPDAVVYPKRENPLVEEYSVEQMPPLLAVEITSPGQTIREMVAKCREMLDAGVQECWIIEPANQTITVCRSEQMHALHAGEMLESIVFAGGILVDDIFAE
jgi:Uma2 family endonuclease